MRRRTLLGVLLVGAVVLAACGNDGGDEAATPGPGADGTGVIHTVDALAPLANRLVEAYEEENPGAGLSVAVSPQDEALQAVTDRAGSLAILPTPWLAGAGVDSTVVGRTLTVIAVPQGNPAQVTGLDAFAAGSGLRTRACGPDTPFGNFAGLVLNRAGVTPEPDTVASGCADEAVNQVAAGELDAALVFRTEADIPDGVETVAVPDEQNLIIEIAHAELADNESTGAFVEFLGTDRAKEVLMAAGYLP
jgi:molybdate transport system substrate-binding protein